MRRSSSRRDRERVRHVRAARIGNGAADLRVLDGAPEVALLVVLDVVVLLGCPDEPPRDAVRLRAGEDFLSLAGGDQATDAFADGGPLAIVRDPEGFVAVLRIADYRQGTAVREGIRRLIA